MSDGNGTAPEVPDTNAAGMSRILSLQSAKNQPKHALTRAQRAEVERITYDLVIQECAKVHEFYLTQIPNHVATMIQDALVGYGLIKLPPLTVLPDDAEKIIANMPEELRADQRRKFEEYYAALAKVQAMAADTTAPAVSENASGDTAPSDTEAPAKPMTPAECGLEGEPPSTGANPT